MPVESHNLPRLMAVAHALGALRERVVFVGGATVNLYSTSAITPPEPRVTEDVDCIVEIAPHTAYYALEYGRYNIMTNAIAPGAILTPMVAEAFKQVNPTYSQHAKTEYAQRNPTKRLGKPAEVAKLVAFLLSEDAAYLNGQTIAIDGSESNIYGNS